MKIQIRCGVVLLAMALAAPALGFHESIHREITHNALSAAHIRVEIAGTVLTFTDRALVEIADANELMDSKAHLSAALFKPERHFTNEEYEEATKWIGMLREEIFHLLEDRDGRAARARFGWALHAIQDFYSHSNWVEMENTATQKAIYGKKPAPAIAFPERPCPDNASELDPDLRDLTLAHFGWLSLTQCLHLPRFKCQHGNWTLPLGDCPGINKDLDDALATEEGVAMSVHHPEARRLAAEATREFARSIIGDDAIKDDLVALSIFFGTAAVGWVVDATGSMVDDIAAAASAIESRIRNAPEGSLGPGSDYPLLFLKTFIDPLTGDQPLLTSDVQEILDRLAAIEVVGGVDCPEPSFAALLEALKETPPGSELTVLTDANAHSPGLFWTLDGLARYRQTRISFLVFDPDPCPRGSLGSGQVPVLYHHLAFNTGGFAVRVPGSSASLKSTVELLPDLLQLGRRALLLARADDGTAPTIGEVPVDSTVETLVVSAVSVDSAPLLAIYRPSGEELDPGAPGVRWTATLSGPVVVVEGPETGRWRLEARGGGEERRLRAESDSGIDFARFRLVEENDEIHGGYSPVHALPAPGQPVIGDARLFGPLASATFSLIGESGEDLGPISLVRRADDEDPGTRFVGGFLLPDRPFRVRVRGEDPQGHAYQRVADHVHHPPTLLITPEPAILRVHPGERREVRIRLQNLGDPDRFSINFSGSGGLDPSSFHRGGPELDRLQSGSLDYDLWVPEDIPLGDRAKLWITAENEAGQAVGRGRIDVLVEEPGMPICSDRSRLCLNEGRFSARVDWRDFEGNTGRGTAAVQSDDSGVFWFFAESNWELMIKVLDGCGVNGHFWVFAGAATNVEYTIEVTVQDGSAKSYFNRLGSPAAPILDTEAFPCPSAG